MQNELTRIVTGQGGPESGQAKHKRILLLAERELSLACKRYLIGLGMEVYDGREGQSSGEEAGSDSEWLTSNLFPALDPPEEPTLADQIRSWMKRAREGASRVINGSDEPAVFFCWGEFDAIILQDLWLTRGESARSVALGCVLASEDYYLRGNFAGRKIVLVTDPGLFEQGGARRPPFDHCSDTGSSGPQRAVASCDSTLRLLFDSNGQIAFLPLVGDGSASVLPLQNLNRLLSEAVIPGVLPEGAEKGDSGPEGPPATIRRSALLCLMEPLKKYIATRAQVVLVDDDSRVLKEMFDCLACEGNPPELPNSPAALVLPLAAPHEIGHFTRFPDLVASCSRLLSRAMERGEDIVFVTDILFDRVPWQGVQARPTGIDLIEKLRGVARDHRMHVGIVAFTGFPSPFITTSAYHRGADAVIFKGKDVFAGGHARLTPDRAGIDRLLFMLAFLCFKKQFLRAKMRSRQPDAEYERMHLKRVLPRYAVSPHLREEWDDTLYMLETMLTHSSSKLPAEVQAIHKQILVKYGLGE